MPNLTTNYDFNLPLVNNATDQDLWGGYLNDNWTAIDSLLFTATNWVKREVSGTDTATIADRNKIILGNATSGSYVQTLPSAATVGDGFAIGFNKADASANTVSVTRAGSDTIGGSTSAVVLSARNQTLFLVSDGVSNWNYLSGSVLGISQLVSGTLGSGVGAIATAGDLGTVSSGTVTPLATTNGNFNYYTNDGAHTLAVPAGVCTMVIEITNGASAGAITTSGYTQVTGDAFTTTNGDKFMCYITKNQSSLLNVVALQ